MVYDVNETATEYIEIEQNFTHDQQSSENGIKNAGFNKYVSCRKFSKVTIAE